MEPYPNSQMDIKEGNKATVAGPEGMGNGGVAPEAMHRFGMVSGGAEGVFQGRNTPSVGMQTEPLHPSIFIG